MSHHNLKGAKIMIDDNPYLQAEMKKADMYLVSGLMSNAMVALEIYKLKEYQKLAKDIANSCLGTGLDNATSILEELAKYPLNKNIKIELKDEMPKVKKILGLISKGNYSSITESELMEAKNFTIIAQDAAMTAIERYSETFSFQLVNYFSKSIT